MAVVKYAGFIVANISTLDLNRFRQVTTQAGTVYLLEHHVQTVFDTRDGILRITVMALDSVIGSLALSIQF